MKKFLISVILIVFFTPSLFSQKTYDQNNDSIIPVSPSSNFEVNAESQYSDIDEAISAFEETVNLDEWYEWFNSLTPEQQNLINYRPSDFPEKQQATDEVDSSTKNLNPIAPPRLPEYTIDSIDIVVNQDEFITTVPSQNISNEDSMLTPTPTPFIDNLLPNTQTVIPDSSITSKVTNSSGYVNDSYYCSINFVKATSNSITVTISFYSSSNIQNKIS